MKTGANKTGHTTQTTPNEKEGGPKRIVQGGERDERERVYSTYKKMLTRKVSKKIMHNTITAVNRPIDAWKGRGEGEEGGKVKSRRGRGRGKGR